MARFSSCSARSQKANKTGLKRKRSAPPPVPSGRRVTQRLPAFARRQALKHAGWMCALIESLKKMFARTLGPRIALEVRLPDDLWPAKIDSAQLESALLNLVINARDAMPDGGQLNIEVLTAS